MEGLYEDHTPICAHSFAFKVAPTKSIIITNRATNDVLTTNVEITRHTLNGNDEGVQIAARNQEDREESKNP